MEKLYTVLEMSKMVGISTQTIRVWLRCGAVKGVKMGKSWRVKESDLKQFMDGIKTQGEEVQTHE